MKQKPAVLLHFNMSFNMINILQNLIPLIVEGGVYVGTNNMYSTTANT